MRRGRQQAPLRIWADESERFDTSAKRKQAPAANARFEAQAPWEEEDLRGEEDLRAEEDLRTKCLSPAPLFGVSV